MGNNQYNNPYKPEYCDKIPDLFKYGRSITQVAVKLGISRETYYTWKERYPDFAAACKMGESISQAEVERIFWKGIRGKIKGFQSTSMIFLLKSRFRDCYSDDDKKEKTPADTIMEKLAAGEFKLVKGKNNKDK